VSLILASHALRLNLARGGFFKQAGQIKYEAVDFLGCFKYYNYVTMNCLKSLKKYSFLDLNQN
jgi:hypothetical protein